MSQINYVKGDATAPQGNGMKIIVHCCNTYGLWGSGFVLALSKKWRQPEYRYRDWYVGNGTRFALGEIQIVTVADDTFVCNLIGQEGVGYKDGKPPIRYDAIRKGLKALALRAHNRNASIHMPRMGCGLAGGKWEEIEAIINSTLIAEGIPVTVYDM